MKGWRRLDDSSYVAKNSGAARADSSKHTQRRQRVNNVGYFVCYPWACPISPRGNDINVVHSPFEGLETLDWGDDDENTTFKYSKF